MIYAVEGMHRIVYTVYTLFCLKHDTIYKKEFPDFLYNTFQVNFVLLCRNVRPKIERNLEVFPQLSEGIVPTSAQNQVEEEDEE